MASHRPDLVVMDCMSYTQDHKEAVRAATGTPTLLAVSTMARIAAELMQ
jgi:protein AroM